MNDNVNAVKERIVGIAFVGLGTSLDFPLLLTPLLNRSPQVPGDLKYVPFQQGFLFPHLCNHTANSAGFVY